MQFSETLREIMDRCKARLIPDLKVIDTAHQVTIAAGFNPGHYGIPPKYASCSFETFLGNEKLVDHLKKISSSGENLVLVGNTGCGKTHLAVAVIRYLTEVNNIGSAAINFIPIPELLLKIRSSFQEGSALSESELIDKFTWSPLLVLDDLGAEKTTEYSITTLGLIIDRRLRYNRQVLITTNLTLAEIEEKLSARIASRLSEMNIVKITMPDYRKRRNSP